MKHYPLNHVVVRDTNGLAATIYRDNRKGRRIVIDDLPERHYQRLIRALGNMRVSVELLDYIELTYRPQERNRK